MTNAHGTMQDTRLVETVDQLCLLTPSVLLRTTWAGARRAWFLDRAAIRAAARHPVR
jgi:hypothetical protein